MRRWVAGLAGVAVLLGTGQVALAGGRHRNARIAGSVLVCNAPGHCFQRQFLVSAVNSRGQTVASFTTRDAQNDYRLHVAPGGYQLVARSSGLNCTASVTAVAHEATHQNITCPVP
jgi:hypothetical protein